MIIQESTCNTISHGQALQMFDNCISWLQQQDEVSAYDLSMLHDRYSWQLENDLPHLCNCLTFFTYSQPHLIGTWLIGSSGSDQDFTPDNHCDDRQVASLSVITMAYQVRNLDHFLNSRLTRFRLSGVDCICIVIHYEILNFIHFNNPTILTPLECS